MRFKLFFLLLLSLPASIYAQKALEIELSFGAYTNDHAARKFYGQEKEWSLKGNVLSYRIEAHEKVYVDTLDLKPESIKAISELIEKDSLLQSVDRKLETNFLDKRGYSESIRGYIKSGDDTYTIMIKANGYSMISETLEGKRLKNLEQLFYQIVDQNTIDSQK